MKNSLFRTAMEWLLITSLIFSCIFFARYYFLSHDVAALSLETQAEFQRMQQADILMKALVADANEYAKKDPQIIPVLESVNARVKPPGTPAPSPAPAAKPPGK